MPAGRLFVMGDNRDNSARQPRVAADGGVGLLSVDNLVGRVDAVVGSWDLGMRSQPVYTWLSGFRWLSRFFTAVRLSLVSGSNPLASADLTCFPVDALGAALGDGEASSGFDAFALAKPGPTRHHSPVRMGPGSAAHR